MQPSELDEVEASPRGEMLAATRERYHPIDDVAHATAWWAAEAAEQGSIRALGNRIARRQRWGATSRVRAGAARRSRSAAVGDGRLGAGRAARPAQERVG